MTEILTAGQMREIEARAIAGGVATGLHLMERAGQGVVEALLADWPDYGVAGLRRDRQAAVLCGPGNNGGDGFVIARLLADQGWKIDLFLFGDAGRLPPDARANAERWGEKHQILSWDDTEVSASIRAGRYDLIVDALFGTGLARGMPPETRLTGTCLRSLVIGHPKAAGRARVVAVDIPSGLCSDSGRDLGGAFAADLTVSFHRPKVGHYLNPPGGGAAACGALRVAEIGLPSDTPGGVVRLAETAPGALRKDIRQHKYAHGHALVLSGGSGAGGAARLAARGALRIGAGLVTLGCPPDAVAENAAQLNAIMLRAVADAAALDAILEDARFTALCLGPGLGLGPRSRDLVLAALKAGRATVLDADALSVFSEDPDALFSRLHGRCVLTPHAGEFARVFPDISQKLDAPAETGPSFSRVDAARAAAERAGCVVLLKGPDTVIADPQGRCVISPALYERAAPWLATAGSGDVLAGFITGAIARGMEPMAAAETAAALHVDCALSFGPGLIAEDIPEELPVVFKRLGL